MNNPFLQVFLVAFDFYLYQERLTKLKNSIVDQCRVPHFVKKGKSLQESNHVNQIGSDVRRSSVLRLPFL